jgi:hypothetical protein
MDGSHGHLRLAMLRLPLAEARGSYDVILTTLFFEGESEDTSEAAKTESDQSLASSLMYGQYETLMAELEITNEADFMSFLRIVNT